MLLYPNENSHLSVRSNTLLLLSSGKASAACENLLLLCFIKLLPNAAVPKALCVPDGRHSGAKEPVQLLKLIPT